MNIGLVVARPGEPNDTSLGVLISNHRSLADPLIGELELKDGDKHARTRLVELARFLEPGSPVDPRCDLKPMSRQPVER